MAQTIKLKRSAVAGRIPNVSDLELGEIAINTYDGKMYIKKSVNGEESISEIGQDASLGAVFTSYTFTATANQTVFTGNDNSGSALDIVDEFSNVFMNGILLDPEIDFTVSSDGLTLTLTEPAEADDILQINSFDQAIFNGTLNVDALALTGMAGEIVWNSDEETIDVPLNDDVTLQLGQEFVFRGKATEAISNGDVVMFAGAQGGHLLIAKANMSAVGFLPEHVIGIATQDLNVNDFGFVTELGKVRDLDTSGYSEGDILYLDPTTAGALTVTKPTPPSHAIQMCAVVRSHGTQGTLLVRPTHMADTDEIAEGSSNLYFTVARAIAAIKADGAWNASDWDTAYSWGDHSTEGYLTSVAFNDLTSTPTTISGYGITDAFDGAYSSLTGKPTLFSGSYTDLTNKPTIPTVPTTVSSFTNDSGYITDYTVTQGDVTAHQAALSITESQISDLGSYLTSETNTTLQIVGNTLRYTDETGANTDIDLSLYLDDTNLSRLVSGSLDANGTATFTRDDDSTFTVDFSQFFDDTNLARITSAAFNTTDGVLTLTRDDATTITADLDGRYLTSIPYPVNASWWNGGFVKVGADGVMEMGKYMDFHTSDTGGNADYDLRVTASPGVFSVGGQVNATGGNSGQWNTAYGWGDHSSAGYLTSFDITTQTDSKYLRSDEDDTTSGNVTFSGSNWYLMSLGARGASAGAYGIGNRSNDAYRQLTFHVPNVAAYSSTGTVPSFGWYSNGSVELMNLESDSGDLTIKGGFSIGTTPVIDSSRNVSFVDGTFSGTVVVGSDITRKPIQVKSETYAEVQFFTNGTEYARIGTAEGGALGTVEGDFYTYSVNRGKMHLIVPKDGSALKRENGSITIWDSSHFANNSSNWNTAYGWGNHANANYIVGGGTWTGGTGSSYTTLAQSVFASGNTKFTFYGNGGKMDVITDGEFYANEGAQRVFHDTYHPNADKWTTARTLSLTGDVTGSVSWDGSANASITATVNNDSHNHDHSDGNFTINGGGLVLGNRYMTKSFGLPYFTNGVADLAVDITLGNYYIQTVMEFEITGTYSNQNTTGLIRRKWYMGFNANNGIWESPKVIDETIEGHIASQIYVSDPFWDSGASTYKIRVYHKVSTGNAYSVKISLLGNGHSDDLLNNLSVGSVITASTANSHTVGLNTRSGYRVGGATVIDSSRNIQNISQINSAGASGETIVIGSNNSTRLKVRHVDGKHYLNDGDHPLYLNYDKNYPVNIGGPNNTAGLDLLSGDIKINGTSVIDSSRNISAGIIQNGSAWINDGSNYNSYNENIRLFDPANNGPSVIAFGSTGVSGVPRHSILSYSNDTYGFDFRIGSSSKMRLRSAGADVKNGGFLIDGTTVIDSARNLYNISTLAVNGTRPASAQAHIQSTVQYALELVHNLNSTAGYYYDTLSLLNDTNVASNYTQIGFRTRDADGQHHRATILSRRDGSLTHGGELIIRTRVSGGNPTDTLTLKSNGDVRVDRGDLQIGSLSLNSGDGRITKSTDSYDNLIIGSGNTALRFINNVGQKRIIPRDLDDTAEDGTIDLGDSGSKFRDIHLSTGIVLSGTRVLDSSRNLTNIGTINASGTITTRGQITVGDGETSSYIMMSDLDQGGRYIHCNSNRVGFLTSASGWGSWCNDDGSWESGSYISGSEIRVSGSTAISSSRDNLYLNSSNAGGGRGIFFRDGFGVGNYNCSITAEDNSGSFPDGIHISGYDGVTIGTGSNARVTKLKVDQAGDTTLYGNLKINGTTVVDTNRNLTNVGSVTTSGAISVNRTNNGNAIVTKTGSIINFQVENYTTQTTIRSDTGTLYFWQPNSGYQMKLVNNGAVSIAYDGSFKLATDSSGVTVTGRTNSTTGYQVNGTTVIDGSRNITNISTLSVSDSASNGTSNGMTHYQWEGATYRNPAQWTARQVIRIHNDTTGDNGHYPSLVLYNESGLQNSTVGLSFASREADGAGNSVPLAGIHATKTIVGNSGAWSSGSLTAYVKDLGTRRNVWTANTNGTLTVHNDLKFGAFTLCKDGSSLGWGAKAGVQVTGANQFRFHASSGNLDVWVDGLVNSYTGFQIADSTVIDSSRQFFPNNIQLPSSSGSVGMSLSDGALHVRSFTDKYHKIWYYDGIAFGTNSSHGHFRFYAETNTQRNASTGGAYLRFDIDSVTGNCTASGNITAYSDIKLKENINTISSPLDKVLSLRGVTYNRKDQEDDRLHMGVIAQEVEKVIPEVVDYQEETDTKTVSYGNMVGLLIEAIKELKQEIEELKNGNNTN